MPITIYKGQTGPAQLGGANRAATQTAPLNIADSASFKLTQTALMAGKQTSAAFFKKAQDEEETRQASDILDEANRYYEDTRTFEHDYRLNRQGAEARSAGEDFEEFHKKQYEERAQRFSGDPRTSLMWQRQAGQIGTSSVGRGMSYSEQQDKVYRGQVTQQRTDLYYQKMAEAPDDRTVNNLRMQYNAEVAAINTPEQTKVLMAQVDQETALTRINTAIANSDVPEAKRLLSEYREAGALGTQTDEMVKKVRDADIGDQAFNISQDVRLTMPDATKTEKLDAARKSAGDGRDGPDIYKAARYQILQDHSAAVSMQKEQDTLVVDMFNSRIEAAKTPEGRKQIELEILGTPMRDSVRTRLLKTNAQGLKQPLTSNDAKLKELEQRVAREDVTQEELDREYKWHLSAADYKLQTSRLKDEGGNRVNAYNLGMEDRLIKAFGGDPKRERGPKTKRFKAAMNQYVDEYQTQNGRLPSDQDMKGQEDWLLEQVIYDENFIFRDRATERFMIDTLQPSKFDVPDDFKKAVRAQWTGLVPPTDEQVIETYRNVMRKRGEQ